MSMEKRLGSPFEYILILNATRTQNNYYNYLVPVVVGLVGGNDVAGVVFVSELNPNLHCAFVWIHSRKQS